MAIYMTLIAIYIWHLYIYDTYMKTVWERDGKNMIKLKGGQVCWFQYLFWVLKEIPLKYLPILSCWKHQ